MYLSQLRTLCKAMIPGSKGIDNATIDLIINEAVNDINTFAVCLKANSKFDVVADEDEYNLSVELANYLTPDKSGLWFYNGTIWRPVYPRTLKWLDENVPNWRNRDSGSPFYYSVDGDVLTVSPPPETSGTDYFWFYYGKKASPMTLESHFPFSGTEVEFTHLSMFNMAIVKYVKWILDPMLNKDQDANLSYQEYLRERAEKKALFERRIDIVHAADVKLQGPKIC